MIWDCNPVGLSAKARNDKIRLMLQTLLADRFKLVVHREMIEQPERTVQHSNRWVGAPAVQTRSSPWAGANPGGFGFGRSIPSNFVRLLYSQFKLNDV